MTHKHAFERYNPIYDSWFCSCGVSADRFGNTFDAKGERITADAEPDPGVRSGRELLTC